jgi:hypothetical protein
MKFPNYNHQRYGSMDKQKPPDGKFIHPSTKKTKREVDQDGCNAGVDYPPLIRERIFEKGDYFS